jgi:hypothetical protein
MPFGLPKSINADIRMQRPHAKVDDYFDLRLDYGFTKVILKSVCLSVSPGKIYDPWKAGFLFKIRGDVQEAALKQGTSPRLGPGRTNGDYFYTNQWQAFGRKISIGTGQFWAL